MKVKLFARMASRLGWLITLISPFFCPGCDSPPRFEGVGNNDDHPASPVPASPEHPHDTEP